jgi:TolA-binding protein
LSVVRSLIPACAKVATLEVNVTLFVLAMLAAIGAVSIALVRQVLFYSRRAKVVRLQERNRELHRKQEELKAAYRQAQEQIRQAEVDRKAMATQLAEAKRRVQQAEQDNFVIVHELGETGGGRQLFQSTMALASTVTIGQAVVKDCKLRNIRHLVEIWADNAEEALKLLRASFTPEAGFNPSRPAPPPSGSMAAE